MKQMSGGSSIRRMGMKNRLKKIAVIGLSACLALGMLSGCSKKETFQADAAAITVNGDEISAGLVKFATHYSQALMESMLAKRVQRVCHFRSVSIWHPFLLWRLRQNLSIFCTSITMAVTPPTSWAVATGGTMAAVETMPCSE